MTEWKDRKLGNGNWDEALWLCHLGYMTVHKLFHILFCAYDFYA